MVRVATEEDLTLVGLMAFNFANRSPYASLTDGGKILDLIREFFTGDPMKTIFVSDEGGMIVCLAYPFIFGNHLIATDVAWWVDEDKRGTKIGKELIDAYEQWATDLGCTLISMVCLDDDLGKYYEKRGYKLYERAYMKEVI